MARAKGGCHSLPPFETPLAPLAKGAQAPPLETPFSGSLCEPARLLQSLAKPPVAAQDDLSGLGPRSSEFVVCIDNTPYVVFNDNMKATPLLRLRRILSEIAHYEAVVWRVPTPVPGSAHSFKYRLALIVNGECVMRYDNERGKGDHRHIGEAEEPYSFKSPEALMRDFLSDVERTLNDRLADRDPDRG